MRVLLVANPRTNMGFDIFMRIPNLGLCSIAANLDKELCDVKIIDLVLAGKNPKEYYKNLLKEYQPDVVGLSCMVFQYYVAIELAKITKDFNKNIKIVLGGYYPTVDYDVIAESDNMQYIDFIIRGEGELAFNEFIKALSKGDDFTEVPSLSYIDNGKIIHNPRNEIANLDELKPPDRDARIIKKGFHLMGYPADAIETSRGCTHKCNFCSILKMYGKSFRKYKIERVLDDIRDAKRNGAKALFVVDDNITLDGKRYKELCEAIIDAKLNDIKFIIQTSIKGLKNTPGLIETMAKAGTQWVFLGIESTSEEALNFMKKDGQFKKSDTAEIVSELQKNGCIVLGGFIFGNPDDSEETLRANFEYAKKLKIDLPVFFTLTPCPKTEAREELIKQGLVTNLYDYAKYDGYHANVKTKYLSAERLFELTHEMEARYPIESGTVWGLIRKFPRFFLKVIPSWLIQEPRYLSGLFKKYIFKIDEP